MCRRHRPVDLTHERDPVDAVRERPAHELVPQGGITTGAKAELEVLEPQGRRRTHSQARFRSEREELLLAEPQRDVDLARAQELGSLLRGCREPDDDPVEMGDVLTPVPWVPAQDELASAIPALDEERAASDRRPGLGVVDPIAPDCREVHTAESVRRQHETEELAPAGDAWAEHDTERLRVDGLRAADGVVKRVVLGRTVEWRAR